MPPGGWVSHSYGGTDADGAYELVTDRMQSAPTKLDAERAVPIIG